MVELMREMRRWVKEKSVKRRDVKVPTRGENIVYKLFTGY